MICIILITLNMFNSNYTFFHWFLFFLGEMMSAPPFIATAISLLQFSWVYFALFFNELLSYATFIAVPHSNASSSIFFILHFWGLHLSNVLLDPPWFSFESASLIIIMLSDSFVPLLWPYECDILFFPAVKLTTGAGCDGDMQWIDLYDSSFSVFCWCWPSFPTNLTWSPTSNFFYFLWMPFHLFMLENSFSLLTDLHQLSEKLTFSNLQLV